MYGQCISNRQRFQDIIRRKAQNVREWVSDNLDSSERYCLLPDPNGLGFRVAIDSIRAKELLKALHREVFSPGFAEPKPWLQENAVWSAWLGYGEPWEPAVHYLPVYS